MQESRLNLNERPCQEEVSSDDLYSDGLAALKRIRMREPHEWAPPVHDDALHSQLLRTVKVLDKKRKRHTLKYAIDIVFGPEVGTPALVGDVEENN